MPQKQRGKGKGKGTGKGKGKGQAQKQKSKGKQKQAAKPALSDALSNALPNAIAHQGHKIVKLHPIGSAEQIWHFLAACPKQHRAIFRNTCWDLIKHDDTNWPLERAMWVGLCKLQGADTSEKQVGLFKKLFGNLIEDLAIYSDESSEPIDWDEDGGIKCYEQCIDAAAAWNAAKKEEKKQDDKADEMKNAKHSNAK